MVTALAVSLPTPLSVVQRWIREIAMHIGIFGDAIKSSFLFTEIIVGYEFTSYTTTEAMGSVTLCAIIYNPPSGEAPRPFTISATTQDGTAS